MERSRFNKWIPYLLLLPSVLYLVIFFAWPMVRAFQLSVSGGGDALLEIHATPDEESDVVGLMAMQVPFTIHEHQVIEQENPNAAEGSSFGTIRTDWYLIEGEEKGGGSVQGWAKFSNLILDGSRRDATSGRVRAGTTTESSWTLDHVKRMIDHSRFDDALITTFLLIIIILPLQFALAIVMALLLQARLRGGTIFLYIYAIPLGVSDLATGLIWFSIFTQNGFLNSFLRFLGLIDRNYIFLTADNRHWMIIAIVLAEVWRATSIVMVIVVAGLQAIPGELIEAGELFGANLWQRLRHIILPLLKPSLQVALILRTILAFQVFAVVLAISGSGLTVLAAQAYEWYTVRAREEVSAAYAGLIMLLSLGISIFYLRAIRTQEEASQS